MIHFSILPKSMLSVGKKVGVWTSFSIKKAVIKMERMNSMNRIAIRAFGFKYFMIGVRFVSPLIVVVV